MEDRAVGAASEEPVVMFSLENEYVSFSERHRSERGSLATATVCPVIG